LKIYRCNSYLQVIRSWIDVQASTGLPMGEVAAILAGKGWRWDRGVPSLL
jgi:hypothetical protein